MQRQLTLLVGVILLTCNLVLIALLNYAMSLALQDEVISIGDTQIEIYPINNFGSELILYSCIFAILTTGLGTLSTYIFLGRYLSPLKKLSRHMDSMDKQNLSESVKLSSRAIEISSLIDSFNNMMKKIRKSFEMQRDFSSYVAHELKTPLAILQTKIEVFHKKEYKKEEADKLLYVISIQVSKLNNIISRILELSHIERIELREDIPLDILLEDLLMDFEETALREDIKLEFNVSTSRGNAEDRQKFNVIGNYTLLYQAFSNLVDNAIKYSYKNTSVKVIAESNKDNICIRILDEGMGIREKDKDYIFEPFFRGEDFAKLKKDGIGIGLSFSKKVFEHHKAKMNVGQNRPNGTIMEIYFERYGKIYENITCGR